MNVDYSNLKIAELKTLLIERNLPLTGKKQELIDRLTIHEAKAHNSISEVKGSDEVIVQTPEYAAAQPTNTNFSKAESDDSAAAPALKAEAASTVAVPIDISKLTDEERMELRKKKFGTFSEQEKKLARARRFNLSTPEIEEEKRKQREMRFGFLNTLEPSKQTKINPASAKLILADLGKQVGAEELEKRSKRAARFGIVDEESKKRIRMERFGIVDEAEQLRRRIERFGPVEASH